MSKRLYDFECKSCSLVTEDLVDPSQRTIDCPQCHKRARRIISTVRINKLDMAMSSSASPESISYFDKVHRERKAIEEKSQAEHGDYGSAAGAD